MRTSGTTYQWREGHSHSVPASVAAAEIEKLQEVDESVKPAALVEVSKPEEAPLHPEFTWDDSVAGQKWREDEARRLIRGYYVVHEQADAGPKMIIANVSVKDEDGDRGYVSTELALSRVETREQVLQEARDQLKAWERRYGHLDAAAVAIVRQGIARLEFAAKQADEPAPKAKYRDRMPRGKAIPVTAL